MKWLKIAFRIPVFVAVVLVRIYQKVISPLLGPNCRFNPTCSEYFIQAVQKHGFIVGAAKGFRRITKCHPWNPGGYDPP